MATIAEAVANEAVRADRLFCAAQSIQKAECLPQETRDAIIKHISDARAKHPLVKPTPAPAAEYAQPDTRPGPVRAAVSKAVDKVVAAKKTGK